MEEAIWYDDVLTGLERQLSVTRFSFKITVICETIQACFQLEEIIFQLRNRIIGVTSGRWNYLSSIIKRFQNDPSAALSSRNKIPFDASYLVSYMKHIVTTAHKRGCHAIAGASNIVPRMGDKTATLEAQKLVKEEKNR